MCYKNFSRRNILIFTIFYIHVFNRFIERLQEETPHLKMSLLGDENTIPPHLRRWQFHEIRSNPCFDLFVMGCRLASKKIKFFLEQTKNYYDKCSSYQIKNQKMGCYKFGERHRDTPILN